MKESNRTAALLISLTFLVVTSGAQTDSSDSAITRVILLGTGTPNPDPNHSGCSVAIVVNDTPYIIDFGPGLIRKAAALSPRYGGRIRGLEVKRIKRAFLTHLHSDHTTGYPDLILTPWVMGRDEPLEVYGPEGIVEMTENILRAYREDIRYRLYGLEPANNQGWRVNTHEITTPDKVVVISGDTRPCENIIKYGKGADILVHEVYCKETFDKKSQFWRNYHLQNHTSTYELGEIANKTKPRLTILYHILSWGAKEEDILKEISEVYSGKVVAGRDLGIY
jgi:ribonuclease Z